MATNDIEHVIDQICECDFIFSSSLHGIIFSHSLGIPAIHLENIVLMDDTENFKFKDYYSVLRKFIMLSSSLVLLSFNSSFCSR